MDEEFNKLLRESHKRAIQDIRKRYVLDPLIRKKEKETGKKVTEYEMLEILDEAKKKVQEGIERRGT